MLSFYTFFKTVHVLGAIFWLGGVVTLTALGAAAEAAGSPEDSATLFRFAEPVGGKLIGPGAMTTIVSGIVLIGLLGWAMPLWILLAIAGAAISMVVGGGLVNRYAGQLAAARANAEADPVLIQQLSARLTVCSRINIVVLVLVVADMVIKPVLG